MKDKRNCLVNHGVLFDLCLFGRVRILLLT